MKMRWLACTLLIVAMSLSVGTILSANESEEPRLPEDENVYFQSITGTVKEIAPHGDNDSMQLVTLDVGNDEMNRIVITDETVVLDEIEIGSKVIAFYDVNKPMILIYPPQYTAEVVALKNNKRFVKVDRFDQNLVSADGMLKLNISDRTKITLKNGKKYKGNLGDCNLAVIYRFATHSIPAQTTPKKIIVLGGPGCETAGQS